MRKGINQTAASMVALAAGTKLAEENKKNPAAATLRRANTTASALFSWRLHVSQEGRDFRQT